MAQSPAPATSSPTSHTRKQSAILPTSTETIPLDHPSRTTPLHPSLPSVRVSANGPTTNINPLTLQPFTDAELKSYNFDKVQADHKSFSKAELEKARDDAVRALKEKIDERDAKIKEIDKEIDDREKIREVERKVYRKKMEARKE